MAQHSLSRTELVIGKDGLDKLRNSKVVVFGVGGVGGFVIEALTRAGVGTLIIVDNDTVSLTNLNRQIIATYDTIDKYKVDIMEERIHSISKECNVITHKTFVLEDNIADIIPNDCDYVVDAIDTVTAKIALAVYCEKNNIPLISSMGTGNKFDPTAFKIADVYDTKVCPLAKVMRYELKKRGVKKLKVVYSEEKPVKPTGEGLSEPTSKRQVPGSISFVPPVAGMIAASAVVRDIVGIKY
ncbi:MAG: tRNA threonylcarbamoyladenosine dehydratase [Inconstantimicrobium porci]|uniref:tRNA threonylcarbamoyladenosine dehydratase n=1 Tax=Inconstantimicrobium porci TaxID=2652291 RepID=A0A7X2N0N3_9CLOT|nr:tRNA threonylcarbamoyladenosine dehydratase [Inconstantimicrobium porci]MDD6769770.1 tRNA threonylcarbamoyladenosine dehydratase [Inconstantimicrobium porci]MDY5911493.1 tRNA threonylcarbamoyladenosine dehydratase [Inconstantimicrobium porci]MSR92509.1 tRNA threonylcarbamoyladenosine dehydratase [Inconstantimicrobium porci]